MGLLEKRIRRKGKIRKAKKITKDISLFLLEIIVNVTEGLLHAFLDQKGLYKKIRNDGYEIGRFSERIRYLQRQGYIEIDDKNKSVRITRKGKIKTLEGSQKCIRDGKWRLLSFDIPEKLKPKRDQFRCSIKRIGYKQVQKSLWACPYVKADEVDLIIDEHKVREFVAYFIVEKTDIEDYLISLFRKK